MILVREGGDWRFAILPVDLPWLGQLLEAARAAASAPSVLLRGRLRVMHHAYADT